MKTSVLFSLLFFVSISSWAQTTTSQMAVKAEREESSRGLVVGVEYTNLTDIVVKNTEKISRNGNFVQETSETFKNGTHVGFAGLSVGYKNLYAWGPIGFEAGGAVLKGLNTSEVPSDVTLYRVQGDVAWAMTDLLILQGGLNVSYIDQSTYTNDYKNEPGVGAQLGLAVRLKKISLLAGYQSIGVKSSSSDTYFNGTQNEKRESTSEGFISGFVTRVSYTF